ncbi:hypothetical protein PT277_03950 [Acetobacteraceae bacterium ESL0709]|nr:hypothetical protein [Acetobacteraceae bacterium ESL0697]MDF7677851.1 hypothetical protein [Acetobacteraceae bacterium ESL0709]
MRLPLCFSLTALTLLGACSSVPNPASNAYGTWKGKLVTEEGACATKEESLLRVRGQTLIFNPGMGTAVLKGNYKEGQQVFQAELVEKGMNNTPYRRVFKAYPVGETIGGTYASPRCRARITLKRE